jgi:hypothetical protein
LSATRCWSLRSKLRSPAAPAFCVLTKAGPP